MNELSTVSGWSPPPNLRSASLFTSCPLALRDGTKLGPIQVAYETYGTPNAAKSNAILICHSLTGDSHVARHDPNDRAGWWDGLVGPGKLVDTDRYFVVCSNVLGSCYGTEGPATPRQDGAAWGKEFPYPTIGDVVAVQAALLDHLGIEQVALVLGGSLGGQQVLRWVVQYPDRMRAACAIACDERASAWVIALQDVGRHAIHHALRYPEIPELLDQALATARMLAMISYRTPQDLVQRFKRATVDESRPRDADLRYEVESYLRYQGNKLVTRFEAHSYLRLTRMLDTFDIAEGFDDEVSALGRIQAPLCLMGIDSDQLFHPTGPQRLAGRLRNMGKDANYTLLTSTFGHDAFLIEHERMVALLTPFFDRHVKVI